jgi:arylsulfatase A-like enzyme
MEAKRNPKHPPLTLGTVALIEDRYKLIHYMGYEGYANEFELYDLANDPQEMDNLYRSAGTIAAELRHELETRLRSANRAR